MSGSSRPAQHYAIILRAARNVLGLRQQELAALSNVSAPAIARIEKGTNVPRSSTWRVLVMTLQEHGVDVVEAEDDPAEVHIVFNTQRLTLSAERGTLERTLEASKPARRDS